MNIAENDEIENLTGRMVHVLLLICFVADSGETSMNIGDFDD